MTSSRTLTNLLPLTVLSTTTARITVKPAYKNLKFKNLLG